MSKWYYYNTNGDKIEVTGGQLKGLAKAGHITPGTLVETENGVKAPAKKVKGLTFADAVAQPDMASFITPPPESVPFVDGNSSSIGVMSSPTFMSEEVNPFTADYSPDQLATLRPLTNITSTLSSNRQDTSNNIYTLLFAPATTGTESKQKRKIYGIVCLVSLALLVYVWLFIWFPKATGNPTNEVFQSVTMLSIFLSIPVVLITLVSFWFWIGEQVNQEKICPECDTLDTKVLVVEKRNKRHVTEKVAITIKNNEGKTVYTGQYKDVQRTKYDERTRRECPHCRNVWSTCKEGIEDGWT